MASSNVTLCLSPMLPRKSINNSDCINPSFHLNEHLPPKKCKHLFNFMWISPSSSWLNHHCPNIPHQTEKGQAAKLLVSRGLTDRQARGSSPASLVVCHWPSLKAFYGERQLSPSIPFFISLPHPYLCKLSFSSLPIFSGELIYLLSHTDHKEMLVCWNSTCSLLGPFKRFSTDLDVRSGSRSGKPYRLWDCLHMKGP